MTPHLVNAGEVARKFSALEAERAERESMGYYLPHLEGEFSGQRVRGVGPKIYIRPLSETFDEFLIHHVMWTLGERWFGEQRSKPDAERHFVMTCWDHYHAWKDRNMTEANRRGHAWSARPDGWTRALFALAVDLYSLCHRGELPQSLINRLKHPEEYQGARYEVAIAGLFVRLGCRVAFLNRTTSKPQPTHCEFIATHGKTGVEIGVEAKSRRRPGVQGRRGVELAPSEVRGDVAPLVTDALGQAVDGKPFMVFVDVNAPMDVRRTGAALRWVEDVEAFLRGLDGGAPDAPVAWNVIVLTNYSFHYATEEEAQHGQYAARAALYPRVPLPNPEFFDYLKRGLGNYGDIPQLS